MDGILCIDKPAGFTSFDVVAKLRGILHTKKIGHAGTLDPMATGVLPVFVGAATKAISLLPSHDKSYQAEFRLGLQTDTLDSTGQVLSHTESRVSQEQLEHLLPSFTGDIRQIPPMYSAVKQGGRPLYQLARQGKTVERPPRSVRIHRLQLVWFDPDAQTGCLSVDCSGGTYIRTLVDDMGRMLGVGGILTALRRTAACGYTLQDCCTLEQVQQSHSEGTLRLLSVEMLFSKLPRLHLSPVQQRMFANGVKLDLHRLPPITGQVAVYGDRFLGLAHPEDGLLRIDKLLQSQAPTA